MRNLQRLTSEEVTKTNQLSSHIKEYIVSENENKQNVLLEDKVLNEL